MADRGEDGGDGGAGEDVAADRGVEHALADESGVRGLVAGTAAGDDGHLGLVHVGEEGVGADHHLDVGETVQELDVGVRLHEPLEHLDHGVVGLVQELVIVHGLHGVLLVLRLALHGGHGRQ